MTQTNPNMSLRVGALLVTLTWFLFTGYQFIKGAFNIGRFTFWISLTDSAGTFGLGFRTMAALIALFTVLFFVAKRDLSKPELLMSVRWILLGEAVAMLALFPCVIWGVGLLFSPDLGFAGIGSFIESTLPLIIESIVIPIVLAKLILELNPSKPARGAIKWALIAGTVYAFMFWLNNTGNWIDAITRKGIEYLTGYADHIFSFALTTVGLLALALYTAYFAKKNMGTESVEQLDLRKVGGIVTALGLYFLVVYVMWLFLGTDAKWSTWYAWFLGHNMDLWALSLPLVGLPLLFQHKPAEGTARDKLT
ncbi:MAG: hypothetical protein ACE14S_11200 [Candidatus Bathyarchaeia archaeon]